MENKVNYPENSFALHHGWDAFALDHGLEIGDFLIFHYILGSHLVVQIFDKTGWEKLDFSENKNLYKTSKADRKSTKNSGPCHSSCKGSMGKQGSNSFAFLKSNVETSQGQCEINDVINVGITKSCTSDNENGVARPQENSKAGFFEDPCSIINRESGGKEVEYRTPIYDLSSLETLTNNLDTDGSNKYPIGAKNSSHMGDSSLNAKNEAGSDDKGSVNIVPFLASMSSLQLEKNLESHFNWSNGVDRRCQIDEGTEMEQSVQELPTVLPSSSNKRTIKERKVVILRDPEMKQWSVLYHQTPKVKLLMSRWDAFCEANNIQSC